MTSEESVVFGDGEIEPAVAAHERDDDLQESLVALSRLATGRRPLGDTLTSIAELAVAAVPGAEGAGLTMLEANRSDVIVTTAPFVADIDAIQYRINQGPCVSAATLGSTVVSGSLGADQRWPQFGSKVARLGVHSALSVPLITTDGVIGALNIYAHAKHTFDDRAARVGELFAVPAAIAVENAQVLAQAKRLALQLQNALTTRSVIDRAVGILMSRSGSSEGEALARLQTLSQNQHQKLRVVAQTIVDQAIRRARAAHRADTS